MILRAAAVTLGLALLGSTVSAADTEPETISAKDLAARLSAIWQDGASYVRLLLNVKQFSRYHQNRAPDSDKGTPH